MKILSIIIVSYNSDDQIIECLLSIEKYNSLKNALEVIIVDNYTDNKLQSKLDNRHFSFNLLYIHNKRNLGFGSANNIGVKVSHSQKILFLNPDTIWIMDIIPNILKSLSSRNKIVGFTLIDKCGRLNNSYSFYYEYLYLFPLFSIIKRLDFYFINTCSWLNKISWPWGAAFAINKQLFIEAGGFDENIFLCNEEADLKKRLGVCHMIILHDKIIHLEGHGNPVSEFRYYQFFKSLDYYFKKYSIHDSPLWTLIGLKMLFKKKSSFLRIAFYKWRKKNE